MELTNIKRNKSHYYLIVEVIGISNIPKRFVKPDPFVAITFQGLMDLIFSIQKDIEIVLIKSNSIIWKVMRNLKKILKERYLNK